jgi:hypothetical protein
MMLPGSVQYQKDFNKITFSTILPDFQPDHHIIAKYNLRYSKSCGCKHSNSFKGIQQ